jgi:hypothetical protein
MTRKLHANKDELRQYANLNDENELKMQEFKTLISHLENTNRNLNERYNRLTQILHQR